MTHDELRDRLRLARTDGVGPVTFNRLLRDYESAAAAIDALPGLAAAAGRAARTRIPSASEAQREMDAVAKLGGRILVLDGPDYPPLLGMLEIAPPVLTVLGDVSALATRAVAMVGARNASAHGQRIAEALSADLVLAGVVVVSGLARGIDAAAHRGALSVGRTVAAVAGGVDVVYPPENAALQARIAKGGCVVAEAPLGTAPQARHFPRRNRIIAGLSLGVVVIEAAMGSGSLITARMAQEMDRDVFAVPGSPLDPRCRGSNDLLRAGSVLTETAGDVLAHLTAFPDSPAPADLVAVAEPTEPFQDGPDPARVRQRVVELLGFTPTPVDDLVRRCQFSAAAVAAALSDLELSSQVELLPGHKACLLVSADHDLRTTI